MFNPERARTTGWEKCTPLRHAIARGHFHQHALDLQYRGRGLYAPPRGYQWAQSGNDAVLVAVASGLIGAVIGGALN